MIQKWAELGYPDSISISGGVEDPDNPSVDDPTQIADIPIVQEASDIKNPCNGLTVFDIIEGVDLSTNNQ